jgi:prophage DNA circulation protein
LVDGLLAIADSEPDMDAPVIRTLRATAAVAGSYLAAVAGDLPDVVDHTPVNARPVAAIAYSLYEDGDREEEIIARNRGVIKHPLAAPGKVPLEVATA